MFGKQSLNLPVAARMLGLVAVAVPAAGFAQERSGGLLDEITVTAQKREQSAQDVPISITAYSAEQLRALGTTTARELADTTAGVQINMEYANAPSFTVRGINSNDFAVTMSPTVAVYVDGIYKASNINSGAQLFDIASVEILKGPQGTLWGKNTTGGAVNVQTARPTQDFESYVQASYGEYSRVELEGAISGGFSDTVAGRLSFQHITSDGPYSNVKFPDPGIQPGTGPAPPTPDGSPTPQIWAERHGFDPDPGAQDILAFRGQLLFTPTDTLEVRLIANYGVDKSEWAPTVARPWDPDIYDDNVSTDIISNDRKVETQSLTADVRWEIGEGTLVSLTGWDTFDRNAGGLDFASVGSFGTQTAAAEGAQLYFQEMEQFSQEFRYEREHDNGFFVVGAYYSDNEFDSDNGLENYSVGIFGPLYFETRQFQTQETKALFAHTEWDLSDAWSLNVGLRWSEEERAQPRNKTWIVLFDPTLDVFPSPAYDFTSTLMVDAEGGSIFGPNPFPTSRKTDDWSYRVGLNWTPADNLLAYYAHSRGLKSGGFDPTPSINPATLAPYEDEVLKSHEIGVKWDASESVRLNMSAFHYDYEKPQQRMSDYVAQLDAVVELLTNLDSAELMGIEADLTWMPTDDFSVLGSLALLDNEIKDDFIVSDITGLPIDGNKLPYAPEVAATLLARYEWDFANGLTGLLQGNLNHTGDHFVSPDNLPTNEQSYTTYGARFAVSNSDAGWEVSVFGKNLSNEIYVVNAFQNREEYFISAPRSWGIQFRKDF